MRLRRLKSRWLGLALTLTLCFISGCVVGGPALRPDPAQASSRIQVGSSTAAQVKTILGTPWRTTNYGESYCGCPHSDLQEVWEYRGADSTGSYRLHIEFDDRGIARILVKTSNATGTARVLASSMPDQAPHGGQHAHSEHHHAEHGLQAGPSAQP
jgi:hypothetical protein